MINLNYIKIYKQDNEFIITNDKPYADTFNKIDLSYFPLNFFNDVNSETIILYRHYTGNDDIPYMQKILKEKYHYPKSNVQLNYKNDMHIDKINFFGKIRDRMFRNSRLNIIV